MVNPADFANPFRLPAAVAVRTPSMDDVVALGAALSGPLAGAAPRAAGPSIGIDRGRRQLFVQGHVFDEDDAASALQSEALLAMPATGLPTTGGWEPLDEGAFRQYLSALRAPPRGRLFRENFAVGAQQLRQLGGHVLQFAGAEQAGTRVVDAAQREIDKREPFTRRVAEVDSAETAIDWFVSVLGQQGPMVLQSVAAGVAGAVGGTAIGGPGLGTLGGVLAGVVGRRQFQQRVLAVAAKRRAGQELLPDERALLRNAAAVAGATIAATAAEAGVGLGDIYGEMRGQGVAADDNTARLHALGLTAPYAALGVLPEFLIAGRLLGAGGRIAGRAPLPAGASLPRRIAEFGVIRPVGGAAVYGALSGATEVGQEGLLLAGSGQALDSPEALSRFVESFAAGAAVGGVLGGVANLRSRTPEGGQPREPVDLLAPGTQPPPVVPPPAGPLQPGEGRVVGPPPGDAALRAVAHPVGASIPLLPGEQGGFDIGRPGDRLSFDELMLRRQQGVQPMPGDTPAHTAWQALSPQEVMAQDTLFDQHRQLALLPERAMQDAAVLPQPVVAPIREDAAQIPLPAEMYRPDPEILTRRRRFTAAEIADRRRRFAAMAAPVAPPPAPPAPRRRAVPAAPVAPPPAPPAPRRRAAPATAIPAGDQALRRAVPPAALPTPPTGVTPAGDQALRRAVPAVPAVPAVQVAAPLESPTPGRRAALPTAATAWHSLRPNAAPEFIWLPLPARNQWTQAWQGGEADAALARRLTAALDDDVPLAAEVEQNTQVFADPEATAADRDMVVADLADVAYFHAEGSSAITAINRAREFFERARLTDEQIALRDGVIIDTVNGAETAIEAYYKTGRAKGQAKPWFVLAQQRGLLPRINSVISGIPSKVAAELVASRALGLRNFPATMQQELRPAVPVERPTASMDLRDNPAKKLADLIHEINTLTVKQSSRVRASRIATLTKLYAATATAGLLEFRTQAGIPVSEYFAVDGTPLAGTIDGLLRVRTSRITAEQRAAEEQQITQAQRAPRRRISRVNPDEPTAADLESALDVPSMGDPELDLDVTPGPVSPRRRFEADDDGRYVRLDGSSIRQPIPDGQVRLLAAEFTARLAVAPRVHVFRNVADLRQRAPALYREAAAARPQGDFDATESVGYSFGTGQVLIFSDYILTEQQLRFVLAHEALGHFGFRALMSPTQLNAALDAVYNSSAKVRAAVQQARGAREMSRAEAVEEYLADFAATLDTNILARFWSRIKTFLNRLGVSFDDDMARYLVSQSRQYVRNGTMSGSFVRFDTIRQRLAAVEGMHDPDGTGRFSLAQPYYDEANRIIANEVVGRRAQDAAAISRIAYQAKAAGTNIADFMERVSSEVKPMNYHSRENRGYRRLFEIVQDTTKMAMELRTKYNSMMHTTLRPGIEALGTKGAYDVHRDRANEMLRITSRARIRAYSVSDLENLGELVVMHNGRPTVDAEVYRRLQALGRVPLADFQRGFTFVERRSRPMTDEAQEALRRQKDAALAAEPDQARRGALARTWDKRISADSAEVDVEVVVPPQPGLTEDSMEWVLYNEVRDTMDAAAIDLLLSNYASIRGDLDRVNWVAESFFGRQLAPENSEFLEQITRQYLDLRERGMSVNDAGQLIYAPGAEAAAETFAAKFNEAVLSRERDKYQALLGPLFPDAADYDRVVAGIDALKAGSRIQRSGAARFSLQHAIQDLALVETSRMGAKASARQTIAGGHVPFGREGMWQVRIQAVDPETGTPLKIAEPYRHQLLYVQTDTRAHAEQIAAEADQLFGGMREGGLFDVEILEDGEGVVRRVQLVAKAEVARETDDALMHANLNEVARTLGRFGIMLTPQERHRLIVGLTQQNASARGRLMRAGTPGEDPNTIKFVSQHMESMASVVARKHQRHRVDLLFTPGHPEAERLWRGDQKEYDERRDAWKRAEQDSTMDSALKHAIKREFDDYHYTFITKESPKLFNRYKDRGRRLLAFLEGQNSVEYTDFASGHIGTQLRMWTTMAQLGGSFATGLLNIMALATNVIPLLGTYNPKSALGGGHGLAASATELVRALNQVRSPKQSTVEYWDGILNNAKALETSGYTRIEAEFMRHEVASGSMQAALFNALLGSARGRITSGPWQAASLIWMGIFTYTEQASRRATGLAAFRLAYPKALQEGEAIGKSGADLERFAREKATREAVETIENALGEYSMFNRPSFFRGDVRQFIFMYKMFPINTILLLQNLSRKGKLAALGALVMLAGLKGLPFADDLMDILDTIGQRLGLGPIGLWRGSSEKMFMEALNSFAPGWTPLLWRGAANMFLPGNVSDRVSLSNIVPGTGLALPGANTTRELVEIAGPIASFLQGTVATAGGLVRQVAETVGISPDTTTWSGLLRSSPVTMLRAMGDLNLYSNTGAIISARGYVTSENLWWGTYITRMLGFFPSVATQQNDVVRVVSREANYRADIVGNFRGRYVSAMLANQPARAQEIAQQVEEWNRSARGTGLEIPNFVGLSQRTLTLARLEASARLRRGAAIPLRQEIDLVTSLFGLDEAEFAR